MPQDVILTIKPGGKVVTDFEGFQGECCFQAAEEIIRGLKKYGVDVGEPDSLKCKLPTAPLQPRSTETIKSE